MPIVAVGPPLSAEVLVYWYDPRSSSATSRTRTRPPSRSARTTMSPNSCGSTSRPLAWIESVTEGRLVDGSSPSEPSDDWSF